MKREDAEALQSEHQADDVLEQQRRVADRKGLRGETGTTLLLLWQGHDQCPYAISTGPGTGRYEISAGPATVFDPSPTLLGERACPSTYCSMGRWPISALPDIDTVCGQQGKAFHAVCVARCTVAPRPKSSPSLRYPEDPAKAHEEEEASAGLERTADTDLPHRPKLASLTATGGSHRGRVHRLRRRRGKERGGREREQAGIERRGKRKEKERPREGEMGEGSRVRVRVRVRVGEET